ncbi:hypothetical protein Pcac1_g5166 [Phytophthora cactorum]|nr:hypothetical protein Pcac1_g5166 [Phytophthora cactorum]
MRSEMDVVQCISSERRRALEVDETYYDKESEATEQPLLLFLRHTQGPYIYCGRLGYLGHRPASKPLEFRWQLLDVNSLQWEKIRGLLASSETASSTIKANRK